MCTDTAICCSCGQSFLTRLEASRCKPIRLHGYVIITQSMVSRERQFGLPLTKTVELEHACDAFI